MSKYFFHPLGIENYGIEPQTYANHGVGKLDFPGNNMPLYAMTDGTVTFVGMFSDGSASACIIKVPKEKTELNQNFYIRYLHGTYNVNVGDQVKQGDLIGYSGNIGSQSSGAHLHLDFYWGEFADQSNPVQGTISSDRKKFFLDGDSEKAYKLIDDINWNLVEQWRAENGGELYGYCWLVLASNCEKHDKPSSSTLGITGEQLSNFCQQYDFYIDTRLGNGLVNFANALIKVGFSKGAAITIASNGITENLNNCLLNNGNDCNWGEYPAAEGGIDCSINAIHSGGRAYTDIVVSYFSLLQRDWGFTYNECEQGGFEVQAALIYTIVNHMYGGNRFFARSFTVNPITTLITNRENLCATHEIMNRYENNYEQFFVDTNNDVELGALLFERLYECSAGYYTSLQNRAAYAYLMAKCSNLI